MRNALLLPLVLAAAPVWAAGGGHDTPPPEAEAPKGPVVPSQVVPPERVLLLDTEILMRMRQRLAGEEPEQEQDEATDTPAEDSHGGHH